MEVIKKQETIKIPSIIVTNAQQLRVDEIHKLQPVPPQPHKSEPKFPEIRSNSNKGQMGKGGLFNNSFVNDASERLALFN